MNRTWGYQSHVTLGDQVQVTAKKMIFSSNGFTNYYPTTKVVTRVIDCSPAMFERALERWGPELVQDAFYFLSAEDREFLINGCS
jgi:hypothetical protein